MSTPAGSESGLLVLDKPGGMTSHDVVAAVRRAYGLRKVGHAGTLDPMATGVLVVGLNRATRLLGHLSGSEKSYDAVVRLGAGASTDDAEGELGSLAPAADLDRLTQDRITEALSAFRGTFSQVPSAVSAVKVAGKPAYRRVRDGEDVELAARTVTVHALELQAVQRADPWVEVTLSVRCSSGFYVRALARDLGADLGVGGHLAALRRTAVAGFGLEDAVPLAQLTRDVALMPLETAVARFLPTVAVDADEARAVAHGRPVHRHLDASRPTAVLGPDGGFLALYEGVEEGLARPVAVFT